MRLAPTLFESTTTMDSTKEIHVIHATHPLSQELFRMTATPQEVIKANKSTSQVQCTTCSTTRPKLQTCQRVSIVRFTMWKLLSHCFAVQKRVVLFEGMPEERLVCQYHRNGLPFQKPHRSLGRATRLGAPQQSVLRVSRSS